MIYIFSIFEINIAVYKTKKNGTNYKFLRYYKNLNSGKTKFNLIILSYDESVSIINYLTFIQKQISELKNNNNIENKNNLKNITKANSFVTSDKINITYIQNKNKINEKL